MAYAHVRGVVHRDLKPGNIMLGPYGEALVVDWGMAKRVDVPESEQTVDAGYEPIAVGDGVHGATVQGVAKGSPAFMAPEQARGEWQQVGPAADIYALGATLYVLLTGRPAYSEESAKATIEAVKRGGALPPRRLNPEAPRPLDAICMKAMARQPEERYSSAQDLALDVERWLADEPVSVFREPITTRARRWVKRHRTLVAATLAALLIGMVSLATLGTRLVESNNNLDSANQKLTRTNQDLSRAYDASRTDFDEANVALADQFANLSKRNLGAAGPGFQVWIDSLRKLSEYYKRFVGRNADWPEKRREVAIAQLRIGQIAAMVNDHPAEAIDALQRSRALFDQLVNMNSGDREAAFGRALADVSRGSILIDRGRIEEALPLLSSSAEFADPQGDLSRMIRRRSPWPRAARFPRPPTSSTMARPCNWRAQRISWFRRPKWLTASHAWGGPPQRRPGLCRVLTGNGFARHSKS